MKKKKMKFELPNIFRASAGRTILPSKKFGKFIKSFISSKTKFSVHGKPKETKKEKIVKIRHEPELDLTGDIDITQSSEPEKNVAAGIVSRMKSLNVDDIRGLLSFKKKEKQIHKFTIFPSKILIAIPPYSEVKDSAIVYPLIRPYSYASVKNDKETNMLVYNIIEPKLNDMEKQLLEKLKEGLIQVIDINVEDIREEGKVLEFIEGYAAKLLSDYGADLKEQEYVKVMYYIYRDFIGLNKIEPLLRDPYIEDIACDGVGIPIYIVHQKYGSLKTDIIYEDENELKDFVVKLSEKCSRYISYAEPLLDGTLPDGTRIHASFARDITTRGPTFSIRKFKETPFTPVDIINLGTASSEILAYLWYAVENEINIMITGGVATGKTSFLNCISMFIPPESKIVSIEDTRELNLPHENWIPGVSRASFTGSGIGEVTMFELLKESFRQNPDYLIVGEIRGKEAYVMFQGMASGHPSMSTMHSGGIDDMIKRLGTKPISLSPGLISSLDIVILMIHAREKGKSARRIKEVVEIESIDEETNTPRINKSFVWMPAEDSYEYRGTSWVLNKISTRKGIPMNTIIKEIGKRKKFIEWMKENNITKMSDVIKQISLFRAQKLDDILNKQIPKEVTSL
ncbi:MAG: type II/IV secretion system ATPase subunit [Candidatus Aenigmatarchaeota archaeon]